jgi:predicted dehydrogenase
MGLLSTPERPTRIEAVRRNTHTGRGADVSVVLDLMIHDLDLALSLADGGPGQVSGMTHVSVGPFADAARADLAFAGGLSVRLDADRDADRRERTMRLVYPSGEVEIDFLARTFRNTTSFPLEENFTDTPDGRDPLGASVAAFVAAVRGETARPLVTGDEAARALELALLVERSAALTGEGG